jgi:hypothetical protein
MKNERNRRMELAIMNVGRIPNLLAANPPSTGPIVFPRRVSDEAMAIIPPRRSAGEWMLTRA